MIVFIYGITEFFNNIDLESLLFILRRYNINNIMKNTFLYTPLPSDFIWYLQSSILVTVPIWSEILHNWNSLVLTQSLKFRVSSKVFDIIYTDTNNKYIELNMKWQLVHIPKESIIPETLLN